MASIVLLVLSGGVPYYMLLEKNRKFNNEKIFLLSAFLLLCGIVFSGLIPDEPMRGAGVVALISAAYSVYRATKTTNFYKFGYYLVFVNAPFFLLFKTHGIFYGLSLLVTLGGIYLTAKFYEKSYGSANYQHITGITLATPSIGTFLAFYLIALALYPPFPNALFFFAYIVHTDLSPLWYVTVVFLFFGNFYLAMQVMKTTLFGRPNPNIHYMAMTTKEMAVHATLIAALLIFSIFGFKEAIL